MSASAKTLTLGSFNVLNLVPGSTPAQRHYFYDIKSKNDLWDQPHDNNDDQPTEYEQKISWLAAQFDRMACDLVGFQEVFEEAPLREALDRSEQGGGAQLFIAGQPTFIDTQAHGSPARVYKVPRVALAVRGDWQVQARTVTDYPADFQMGEEMAGRDGKSRRMAFEADGQSIQTFYRPFLRAEITLPNWSKSLKGVGDDALGQILVYVCHFKSKAPMARTAQGLTDQALAIDAAKLNALGAARSAMVRNTDAAALRWLIIQDLLEQPNRPVILLGDLNDELSAISTEIAGGLSIPYFRKDDYPDNDREAMRHQIADLSLFATEKIMARKRLRDVHYTFTWDGGYDTLDHILVSKHFAPMSSVREGWGTPEVGHVGSLRVLNDHLLDDFLDDLEHWEVEKHHRKRSDHGQVIARLDWEIAPKRRE